MSRFIHQDFNKGKKEPKPVAKPKPGKYTSKELENTKKIPTKGGYQ